MVCCILLKTLFVLDLPSKLFKSFFTFLSYPPRSSTTMFVCWTLKPSFLSISSLLTVLYFSVLRGVGLAPIWTHHFYNIRSFFLSFFLFFFQTSSRLFQITLHDAGEISWSGIRSAPKFRKKKKNSSSCVYVLHKTSHQEISRPSRAVMAKKCTKKCNARAELLFWLLSLLLFWRSSCRRRRRY